MPGSDDPTTAGARCTSPGSSPTTGCTKGSSAPGRTSRHRLRLRRDLVPQDHPFSRTTDRSALARLSPPCGPSSAPAAWRALPIPAVPSLIDGGLYFWLSLTDYALG